MINNSDVIRLKIPFPNQASGLAKQAHMYICIDNGIKKEFILCTKTKPYHLFPSRKPYEKLFEKPDLTRNPFTLDTTIDCDCSFTMNEVTIPLKLRAVNRNNVSTELYNEVIEKINHKNFYKQDISSEDLSTLNELIVMN